MRGSLSRRWLMLKRANTDAKARTSARVRAVARPATTVAKARTPAKAKGAAALREAHQPPLQRQALPHQALQLQAEISASVHDSLQILICARNRSTGSWRVASQGSLYHNSKVASKKGESKRLTMKDVLLSRRRCLQVSALAGCSMQLGCRVLTGVSIV
jgi:hypothetical protein